MKYMAMAFLMWVAHAPALAQSTADSGPRLDEIGEPLVQIGVGYGQGKGLSGITGYGVCPVPTAAGNFTASVFGMMGLEGPGGSNNFSTMRWVSALELRVLYGLRIRRGMGGLMLMAGPAFVHGTMLPEHKASTEEFNTAGLGMAVHLSSTRNEQMGFILTGNVNFKSSFWAVMFYLTP